MKTEPGGESFDAKKEKITLKVGDDEYPEVLSVPLWVIVTGMVLVRYP